jgi:hypothetical protein
MQLRFASFAVVNSRENLHLQDCTHAGRTKINEGRIAAAPKSPLPFPAGV